MKTTRTPVPADRLNDPARDTRWDDWLDGKRLLTRSPPDVITPCRGCGHRMAPGELSALVLRPFEEWAFHECIGCNVDMQPTTRADLPPGERTPVPELDDDPYCLRRSSLADINESIRANYPDSPAARRASRGRPSPHGLPRSPVLAALVTGWRALRATVIR
ncbi:hypothetical protein [Alienimonas chondri]|uniref:Transcription factor zinc-finger domain-containing protein n=1 Tax=Alienimonas chondri TaxID=2681879 RepID=A0ABX1VCW1_9PLAN|nr:hypothetical protein [Alienimonas chondri]NNJ25608.1 hypothetical protein [Alienimonas chondri]